MDRLSICTTLYFGSTKVRKYFRTLYESTRSCTSTSGSTSEVPVLYTYVYTYTYTYTCTHVIIFTFVPWVFISGGYKYLISYSGLFAGQRWRRVRGRPPPCGEGEEVCLLRRSNAPKKNPSLTRKTIPRGVFYNN